MTQDSDGGKDLQLIKFIARMLGIELTEEQKRIIRAIENHRQVLIVSGNGVGKSFSVSVAKLAFLLTVPDSKVIGTSGSYAQYRDSVWNPMVEMYEDLDERADVPGKVLDHRNTLEIDRNWYTKVISPTDPGDLEGRHANRVMVVIEEADKKYITEEHFDSAYSSITDKGDRFIAIANPPQDQTGEVWERMQSDQWHTINFSSFESHNVRRRRKEVEGLVTLDLIKEDYEKYNNQPWPGVDRAKEVAEIVKRGYDADYQFTDEEKEKIQGLDERWYRRRLGVIPPESSSTHRPLYATQIHDGHVPALREVNREAISYGMDVARSGGDRNVIFAFTGMGNEIRREAVWSGADHNVNEEKAKKVFDNHPDADIAIDASGEGSGLADRLVAQYPNAHRFKSQKKAYQEEKYKDRWAEGLDEFGTALSAGTKFDDDQLETELLKAAQKVEFSEKYYASRDAEVLKATSKDTIKDALGYSPDFLDAAYMSIWAAQFEPQKIPDSLTWGT